MCAMRYLSVLERVQNKPGFGDWLLFRPALRKRFFDAFKEDKERTSKHGYGCEDLTEPEGSKEDDSKSVDGLEWRFSDGEMDIDNPMELEGDDTKVKEKILMTTFTNPLATAEKAGGYTVELKAKGESVASTQTLTGSKRKVIDANLSPNQSTKVRKLY